MSGDGAGLIIVPVAICMAAPIVVGAAALAGIGLAVHGAITAGKMISDSMNKRKIHKLQELQESNVISDFSTIYKSLQTANNEISKIYNMQTTRIAGDTQKFNNDWQEYLSKDMEKMNMEFDEEARRMSQSLNKLQRDKMKALTDNVENIQNQYDADIRKKLEDAQNSVHIQLNKAIKAIKQTENDAEVYAEQHYKKAEELLSLLSNEYEGGRFCVNEIKEIGVLMDEAQEKISLAPQAAYAIIWQAIEICLLALNKAEVKQNEWMMQYRIALQLAEELKASFEIESTLGYLVDGQYAETEEQAKKICIKKDLKTVDIIPLRADDYVYGELASLRLEFDSLYQLLKKDNGVNLSIEDLYTYIDDLTIKYNLNIKKLILEAKLNLNEAMLIDSIEKQLNNALEGGYHCVGSARVGNQHNGAKHIVFEKDGDPEEQICIVLKNDGVANDVNGMSTFNTTIDVKSIKDRKISERKRHAIRERISTYLNHSYSGSNTTIDCNQSTRGRLSNDPRSARMDVVRNRRVERYPQN